MGDGLHGGSWWGQTMTPQEKFDVVMWAVIVCGDVAFLGLAAWAVGKLVSAW